MCTLALWLSSVRVWKLFDFANRSLVWFIVCITIGWLKVCRNLVSNNNRIPRGFICCMHGDVAKIKEGTKKYSLAGKEISEMLHSLYCTGQETTLAHICHCTEALSVQESIRNKHKNLGYMNQSLKNFKSLILTNRPNFSIFLHVCLLLLQTD